MIYGLHTAIRSQSYLLYTARMDDFPWLPSSIAPQLSALHSATIIHFWRTLSKNLFPKSSKSPENAQRLYDGEV